MLQGYFSNHHDTIVHIIVLQTDFCIAHPTCGTTRKSASSSSGKRGDCLIQSYNMVAPGGTTKTTENCNNGICSGTYLLLKVG